MIEIKSTDVREIYSENYFLNQVDGFIEYGKFYGNYDQLYKRYQRNISLIDLKKEHKYLEYGCGRGEVCIFHAARGGVAIGVDFSEDAISLARAKTKELNIAVDFFVSSFSEYPVVENSFDRILASEFIEHISPSEGCEFFNLAYKALKPGGKLLIFTFPNTLQRKYGYPILRLAYSILGENLPKIQSDTISEHYKLYHLNEQNYFTLRNSAKLAGFSNIHVGYDIPLHNESGWIKNFLKKAINISPLRHLLFTNLYLLAEK